MEGGITGKGFLPGKSGNPAGKPKMDKELMAARKAQAAELAYTLQNLLALPYAKVKEIAEDSSGSSLLYGAARLVFQAMNKSDVSKWDWIFRYCAIPAPTKIELTGEDGEEVKNSIRVVVEDFRGQK